MLSISRTTLCSVFLRGLEKDDVEFWTDRRIRPGELWDAVIKTNLQEAHVALVLVSQAFLDSPYYQNVEIEHFPIFPTDKLRVDYIHSCPGSPRPWRPPAGKSDEAEGQCPADRWGPLCGIPKAHEWED